MQMSSSLLLVVIGLVHRQKHTLLPRLWPYLEGASFEQVMVVRRQQKQTVSVLLLLEVYQMLVHDACRVCLMT